MVETVLMEGGLLVLDDVLLESELFVVHELCRNEAFRQVEIESSKSIWLRNGSLNPEIGSSVLWIESGTDGVSHNRLNMKSYPTGTPIDKILATVRSIGAKLGLFPLGGSEESDYGGIAASIYRYSPGSRLAWHFDGSYLGGFAMYVSGEWNEDWGGYFAFQDNSEMHRNLGIGTFVQPRNNRLILFRAGIRHSILSIANDADRPRIGLAGFFLTGEQARSLVQSVRIPPTVSKQSK